MGGRRAHHLGLPSAGETDWMSLGVCSPTHVPRHHPSVWFPLGSSGVAYAKRLCATCDVQVECLDYALANRIDYGVWGGESERSRRRLLRDAYGVDVSIRQGVDGADGLADV